MKVIYVGIACCLKCRGIRAAGSGLHAARRTAGGRIDCVGTFIPDEPNHPKET